jgi:ribokinase
MVDVFVAGALHLDVVVDAPRLPALDETLVGSAVAYRFGGKGGNQAVAAARMGATHGDWPDGWARTRFGSGLDRA